MPVVVVAHADSIKVSSYNENIYFNMLENHVFLIMLLNTYLVSCSPHLLTVLSLYKQELATVKYPKPYMTSMIKLWKRQRLI